MDAKKVAISEEVPASRKLSAAEAKGIAEESSKVYVAKGKKVEVFDMKSAKISEVVEKMLGPTGNLRAPTLRSGKTTLVGFNEEVYDLILGR